MKKILRLALPVLLAACGSSGGSGADARRADTQPDTTKQDTAVPEGPGRSDSYVAPDISLPPTDGPVDQVDVLPGVDHPDLAPDGGDVGIDSPPRIDLPIETSDGAIDTGPYDLALGIDGPDIAIDTGTIDARTVLSPDGRVLTLVDECEPSPTVTMLGIGACPATYAEGLARALSSDGGVPFQMTGAGRCSEGSYVYQPYLYSPTRFCYYDASTQKLIGSVSSDGKLQPCLQSDTVSYNLVKGTKPPCTQITWEVYR
jgi:hypothetical protein